MWGTDMTGIEVRKNPVCMEDNIVEQLACRGYFGLSPLSTGGTFEDPQWIPETVDSTEHLYTVSSCIYIRIVKFNL